MKASSLQFRPPRGATWLTLICLAVLLGLGTWQLHRLEWKEALLARIDSQLQGPPRPLPARLEEPEAWEYARVRVRGRFLHERELYLARGRGWQIITPLLRETGPPVLVVRGFVPNRLKPPGSRPESLLEGPVTLTAIARLPESPNAFTPDNRPNENVWVWRDLDAMAAAAGLEEVTPVFLEASADAPGGWPEGGVTRLDIPNRHLGYAITWFTLAAAILAVYLRASLHRGR